MGTNGEIVVASIFRDAADYIDHYFAQVDALETELGEPVALYVAEGDSVDGTHNLLATQMREHDLLLKVDHGGPKYGSVDHPDRWWRIALVCNAVMDAIPAGHRVIYVESDLIWEPHTMLTLLDDLERVPAVSPLSLQHGRFYDIWGYRGTDGTHFTSGPPFHKALETNDDLVEIASSGSCVAMRPEVARVARFGENDCIVGLGRDIRFAAGGSLWLDRRVSVFHP